jgi:hypothetical protein
VPARPPDMGEAKRSGFLPRMPWRYLALLAAILGMIVLGFNSRQAQRAAELRAELRKVHKTELSGLRADYNGALDKLQKLVISAAAAPVDEAHADDGLRFESLRNEPSAPGLYLRLPLARAGDAEQIAAAARLMEPDWIPGCLGLHPTTARELYEIGEFLLPSFLAHVDEENLIKLRVREETLKQRMHKDLPGLRAAMHAAWFMLVLEQGESRSQDPVRVFLWDMQRDKQLLAARVRAQGIRFTGHILSQGSAAQRGGNNAEGAVEANDCSIASGLRRLIARAPATATPSGESSP